MRQNKNNSSKIRAVEGQNLKKLKYHFEREVEQFQRNYISDILIMCLCLSVTNMPKISFRQPVAIAKNRRFTSAMATGL